MKRIGGIWGGGYEVVHFIFNFDIIIDLRSGRLTRDETTEYCPAAMSQCVSYKIALIDSVEDTYSQRPLLN